MRSIEGEWIDCRETEITYKKFTARPFFCELITKFSVEVCQVGGKGNERSSRTELQRTSSASLTQLSCFSRFSCSSVHIPWMLIPKVRAAQTAYQTFLDSLQLDYEAMCLSKCYAFVLQHSLKILLKLGTTGFRAHPPRRRDVLRALANTWKVYPC